MISFIRVAVALVTTSLPADRGGSLVNRHTNGEARLKSKPFHLVEIYLIVPAIVEPRVPQREGAMFGKAWELVRKASPRLSMMGR